MKKMVSVLICLVAVVMFSGIGQAETVSQFPPQKAGLFAKMKDGTSSLCAIFTLYRSKIEVDCAKPLAEGGYDMTTYTCPPQGSQQVCAPDKVVNISDSYATKCRKVCGPGNGTGYKAY